MAILQTEIVSTLSISTYACMNELIGKLSEILRLDSRITIDSDNNPDPSIARIVVLNFAGSGHKLKLYAYSNNTNYIQIGIMQVATPTTALTTSTVSFVSGVAIPIIFLYSDHMIALVMKGSMYLCAFDSGDPLGWHMTNPIHSINNQSPSTYMNYLKVYAPDTDVLQQLSLPSCGFLQEDNKFVLLPSLLTGTSGTLSFTYQNQRNLIRGGIPSSYLAYGTYVSGGKTYLIYSTYASSVLVVCEG